MGVVPPTLLLQPVPRLLRRPVRGLLRFPLAGPFPDMMRGLCRCQVLQPVCWPVRRLVR